MPIDETKRQEYLELAERRTIRFKKGFKYQLVRDYAAILPFAPPEDIETKWVCFYRLGDGRMGLLVLKDGYAWDGCSGPTHDDDTNMRAGAGHDGGYQLIRHGLLSMGYRIKFDKELHAVCLEDKMNRFRAWCYYQGVHRHAEFAAESDAIKPILEAPAFRAAESKEEV